MTEQMQIRKVEELTNKIRMIESELHRLEEDAFKKQEELTVTVSCCSYNNVPLLLL